MSPKLLGTNLGGWQPYLLLGLLADGDCTCHRRCRRGLGMPNANPPAPIDNDGDNKAPDPKPMQKMTMA